MRLTENLYKDYSISDMDSVISSLSRDEPVFNIFCICIDLDSKNLAEIMSSRELFTERNKKRDITVIGIALGRKGGETLFSRIIVEYLNSGRKICDFKNSILE